MQKNTRSRRRAKKRVLVEQGNQGVQKRKGKTVAYKRVLGMVENSSFTPTKLATTKVTVAKGGWLGSRKKIDAEDPMTLDEAVAKGYTKMQWDGM